MYLKRINVKNYSAFKETGWIDFEPGINLIVGQNNSGKSALLRVFEAGLSDDRHRNADEYRYERLEAPQLYVEVVI
jgi:AAA15 family ATPase/GTPase